MRSARLRCLSALLAVVLATGAASAAADGRDAAALVQIGDGDRAVKSIAIGGTMSFTRADPANPDPWSFYGEVVLGEWFTHHRDAGQHRSFTQLTVAPVVRYTFGGILNDVFIEVGVGLSVIAPRFEDHGRTFSTTFNFDDHASLGKRFGARRESELSVRVEHFSNGGIRNPNPGQNFAQLRYARHF